MNKKGNYFENIVIGSSPLMLLVAINISKKGDSVLIIDKDKSLGGCWQVHKSKKNNFECASHLIERYPGVYKILEEYSSVKFIPLKRDPVRVFKNGIVLPYENKVILFLSLCKLIFGYILFTLIFIIFKIKKEEQINYHIKLIDFLKYRLNNLFKDYPLLGPLNGYACLIEGLLKNCKKYCINFLRGEVQLIKRKNDLWNVKLQNRNYLLCKNLHTTSSINLKRISKNKFCFFNTNQNKRISALISIPKRNLFINQSYASFFGDIDISRIHRLDKFNKSKDCIYYLAEIKKENFKSIEDLKIKLGKRLILSRIIKKDVNFKILKIITTSYTKNSDQLLINDLEDFTTYYSNGNLASGIHKWLLKSNLIKTFD